LGELFFPVERSRVARHTMHHSQSSKVALPESHPAAGVDALVTAAGLTPATDS
jgi:hypothetical protein